MWQRKGYRMGLQFFAPKNIVTGIHGTDMILTDTASRLKASSVFVSRP